MSEAGAYEARGVGDLGEPVIQSRIASIVPAEDPRLQQVRVLLAAAAERGFVEVLVVGVLRRDLGFEFIGSDTEAVRMVGMLEVAKRDVLDAMRPRGGG